MKTVFAFHNGNTVQERSPEGLKKRWMPTLEGVQVAKGEHLQLDSEGEGIALRDYG